MITLVTGSPCSGKTRHAQTLAAKNNQTILVDLDTLSATINPGNGTHPQHTNQAILECRKQLIHQALIKKQPLVVVDCLLTRPAPSLSRWSHRAEIHYVDTDQETCTRRATEERELWTQDLITRWWRDVAPILNNSPHQIKRIDTTYSTRM